jgi:ubiquinone biosynthesis protein Coq4
MLLSLLGCFKAARIGRFDVLAVWLQALRRARRARFLLAEDWEVLLERPLSEVQKELGLWPMPTYKPLAIEQLAG